MKCMKKNKCHNTQEEGYLISERELAKKIKVPEGYNIKDIYSWKGLLEINIIEDEQLGIWIESKLIKEKIMKIKNFKELVPEISFNNFRVSIIMKQNEEYFDNWDGNGEKYFFFEEDNNPQLTIIPLK